MGFLKTASFTAALSLAMPSALAGNQTSTLPAMPSSTPAQIQLADQLQEAGLKYYGSWRCPACHYQGRLFGKEATERLPYVECAKPEELPLEAMACRAVSIRAFPTWIHPSGERREGVQSLPALEAWLNTP